jgi:GH35 family endo-1,4-beta-xylanase
MWAMDNWIKGMMTATKGYVSTWDAINEPISGVGGEFYDLWSADNGDAKNFYWQDYLGDEEYVRFVIAKAREYYTGEEPLKLFVNDYNLESDWDQNKKLKSLIHWIEVWESDNTTKIDGIGTQMHISYYENPETLASKNAAIENMFKLMAATGKLVKISELDLAYVGADGKVIKSKDLTEEQIKTLSDYYKYIVETYMELVPANQQYGITLWCPIDSPASSSWRGGEAVGLWDGNYNRRHTYAGFADGLAGKE